MADLNLDTSVQNQSFSGAFSMGKANRPQLWNNTGTPAPNAYQNNDLSQLYGSSKFSKQNSQPELRLNKIPGPKWSNTQKNDIFKSKSNAPPPGTYDLSSEFEQNHKSQTISWVPFCDMNDKVLAGPLDYDNDTLKIKNKAPVFSLASKGEDENRFKTYMHTPGPQKYTLKPIELKKSHNKKQMGFGSGDKNSIYKNDNVKNPGVGSYDFANKNTIKKSIQFSKSKRQGLELKSNLSNPGAGQYDLDKSYQSLYKTSQATIKHRTGPDSLLFGNKSNPGPGHYPINDSIYKKNPAYQIGKSQRQPLVKNNKVPGPGTYSKIFDTTVSHADLDYYQGFGTKQRGIFQETLGPGPQQYQSYIYQTTLTKGPKINPNTTTVRIDEEVEKPGPQSYNTNKSEFDGINRYKGVSIKHKTQSLDYKNVPGPGTYSIRGKIADQTKGSKFGPSSRLDQSQSQSVFQTSPASYNIKSNIGALPKYLQKHNKSSY